MRYGVHATAGIALGVGLAIRLEPVGLVPAAVFAWFCWVGSIWPDTDHARTATSRRHPLLRALHGYFHLVVRLATPLRWRLRLEGHRTLTHSPFGITAALALVGLPLSSALWEIWVMVAGVVPTLGDFNLPAEWVRWVSPDGRWAFILLAEVAFAIGQLLHLVLDAPTASGLPLGLPVTTNRFRLPLRIRMDTSYFEENLDPGQGRLREKARPR